MMVNTSKVLMVFYMLSCKVHQVLLSNHCSNTKEGVIVCYGRVWTEPASLIQMGQNVSVNCHSDKDFCQNGKLYLILNNVRVKDQSLTVINKTAIQLQLHGYQHPVSMVQCNVECPRGDKWMICGTQFCLGYLPDKPANLTCVIHEYMDNMTCTWDPGKNTHLDTSYKLYLNSLPPTQNKTFSANNSFVIIPLSQLQESQQLSVLVHVENDLGTVYSDPLHFDLNDIVIPATSIVIQNTTIESPVFKTIIWWQKQTAINGTYCEERYKETASEMWHVREWNSDFKTEHLSEYNLEANTMYEFQVRCKLTHDRAFWSRWSESTMYMTPEAEPSSVLDVWRYLGATYQNGSQEVTIFIKPFLPKESRGRILHYRVYYEKEGKDVELCKTTKTMCKVLVPSAARVVSVTAHNSKGSSRPTNITVHQQHHGDHVLPPPTNLKVVHADKKGFFVSWEPPESYGNAVLCYIVEWTSVLLSQHYHNVLWRKVPSQNKTTFIEEDSRIKRNVNISIYAVYQDGTSKACSVQILEKNVQGRHFDKAPRSFSTAANDGNDYDVGVMVGTGFGAALLSIFILVLIAKKSYRKSVTTMLSSVTPKWLYEDYPKLQNSSAIKSLQKKNGSLTHISAELFSDYEDAVITNVEEILVPKEYKTQDDRKESKEAVPQKADVPEETLFVSNSDVIEANGYKPQVSSKELSGNILTSTNEIHSQTPGANLDSPSFPMNSPVKDYVNPMATIWPDENTLLFQKISLVLNSGRSGQSNVFSPVEEEPNTPTAMQWTCLLSDDNIQEQTFIPDELLTCLKTVDNDSTAVMSYFPQSMAK
ncbi:interleukin-23 receptor [Anolis carolinensis]|uniref:interleukin-23 receptor n=1 Tax=Anolis carolinensis TaxID=28377 RepID=UPI002F2B4153